MNDHLTRAIFAQICDDHIQEVEHTVKITNHSLDLIISILDGTRGVEGLDCSESETVDNFVAQFVQ